MSATPCRDVDQASPADVDELPGNAARLVGKPGDGWTARATFAAAVLPGDEETGRATHSTVVLGRPVILTEEPCRPATEDEMPGGARQLMAAATRNGWNAVATYAAGRVETKRGALVLASVAVRLAHPGGARAFATWTTETKADGTVGELVADLAAYRLGRRPDWRLVAQGLRITPGLVRVAGLLDWAWCDVSFLKWTVVKLADAPECDEDAP
jgi:hypothetical protein